MNLDLSPKRLLLSVGELARLVADAGEVSSSLSLALRGRLGAESHRAYQQQRSKSAAFRQEVHLDVILQPSLPQAAGWEIRVRGRLDGLIEELDHLVVEGLKTVVLPANRFREITPTDFPRHRRQLEIYLHLLALARPDKRPLGQLIYLNLSTNRKRAFKIEYHRAEIEPLVWASLADLIARAERRAEESETKRKVAELLSFPFNAKRAGQAEMMEAVTETLQESSSLALEAPTGIGKTVAALYAALTYALRHDKQVLFLTSKTTQQDLIFETACRIRGDNVFPRILLLRARQKLCFLEEGDCSADECEYMQDFQQRLRTSRALPEWLAAGGLHPDHLRDLAKRERLCPYALQISLLGEADLVIGDYNYAFDPGCRLESLFSSGDPSRLVLIVDEAHNLPERARGYYSIRLTWPQVEAAQREAQKRRKSRIAAALQPIQDQFEYYLSQASREADPCLIQLSQNSWSEILSELEQAIIPHWYSLAASNSDPFDDPIIALYRDLTRFLEILKLEGENFAYLLRRTPEVSLEILCLDASPYLREAFDKVHASICMSATLQPLDSYRELLGLDKTSRRLSLPSPFPPENLRVLIDPSVSTLYRERESHLAAMAQKIESFYHRVAGNILAFFPAFELMKRILQQVAIKSLFVQEEKFSDAQRRAQLEEFTQSRHALLCGMMGGVFAEGIDLPGDMAQAAIIVGVPLPGVCAENELIRAYFDRKLDEGFRFAYLYPGMRRAVQAAGRVIRREDDRGIILLLDRRYTQREYQQLLPPHWYRCSPAELICANWETELSDRISGND